MTTSTSKLTRVALAAAIDEEISAVLGVTAPAATRATKGYELYEVDRSMRIRLIKVGLGPINSAIAIVSAHSEIHFETIIILGLCGAISNRLVIGDVVIADSVFQHDSFRSTSKGKKVFLKPGATNYDPAAHLNPQVATDSELNILVRTALVKNKIASDLGMMASGSEFMCDPSRKKSLLETNENILAVDMESIGVAKACETLGVRFTIVKIVTDLSENSPKGIFLDFTGNLKLCLDKLRIVSSVIIQDVLNGSKK